MAVTLNTTTTSFINKCKQWLVFVSAFNAYLIHVFNCLYFFFFNQPNRSSMWNANNNGFSNNLHLKSTSNVLIHKGSCFCSSPFTYPFYRCLCKQKPEIPFKIHWEWKAFWIAVARHPACCCTPPPKCNALFSLNTNWKCSAPLKKTWHILNPAFLGLSYFSFCLYCEDLQSMWFASRKDTGLYGR